MLQIQIAAASWVSSPSRPDNRLRREEMQVDTHISTQILVLKYFTVNFESFHFILVVGPWQKNQNYIPEFKNKASICFFFNIRANKTRGKCSISNAVQPINLILFLSSQKPSHNSGWKSAVSSFHGKSITSLRITCARLDNGVNVSADMQATSPPSRTAPGLVRN